MTSSEVAAVGLMWLVAIYHTLLAGYLVFLAQDRGRLLSAFAFTKGVLGTTLYLVVTEPTWSWYQVIEDELTPLLLATFLFYSLLVTLIIWRSFDLDPPRARVRSLTDRWTNR